MDRTGLRSALCAAAAVLVLFSSCAGLDSALAERNIASEYYAIAEGYAELSKYDKAAVYYRKAALRKEYENAANYGLARMYSLSGKWSEACGLLSALHAKDGENTLIAGAYAYALVAGGRQEEGLALYEMIWRKNSGDPQSGRNYAAVLVLAERYSEALAIIAELKEKYPESEAVKGIGTIEKKAADALTPPAEAPTADAPPDDGPPAEKPAAAMPSEGPAAGAAAPK